MEIICSNVSFSYHPNTLLEKKVFSNIDVTIESAQITGIIGNSGSGKTTLLELISGLILPTSGEIHVGSHKIGKKELIANYKRIRKDVGMVFQLPEEQFFHKTVREELLFAVHTYKTVSNEEEKAVKALKMVGLNETYLDKNPFKLSNGEQRRIAIACILMMNYKVILLDEPTVGLDSIGKKKMLELIKKLKEDYHKTIVIVSHDIDFIYAISNNVIVLNQGSILLSGNKNEIFKHVSKLKKEGIAIPSMVEFIYQAKTIKNIILDDHHDIRDLIKDVYRNV